MRPLLAIVAATQAILALLLALQLPVITDIWPFQPTGSMSYVFIASILIAAAASTSWCLLVRSDRGLAGIALDYLALMVPLCLITLAVALDGAGTGVFGLAVISLVGAVFGAYVLRWSLGRPWRSARPTPRLVLISFAIFVVLLLVAGGLMVFGARGILPWQTSPQLSQIVGVMFLGAAAYFGYGLVDRRWENAGGQLAGFLAYDIVLIVPFVTNIVTGQRSYYDTAGEPLRLNLLIYTVVLFYSGAVAVYYLFINRETRSWPTTSLARTSHAADKASLR